VVIDTAENTICVCGDVVSLFSNVDVIGSVCSNKQETRDFLDRARAAEWEMVPSHDPQLRGHRCYVHLPIDDQSL
jgi:hypothetical protein